MDATEIYKQLKKCFALHLYQINNQYIFRGDWESDYFAMSKSGYCVEVEVKVSVADFKKDYFKGKHRFFQAAINGKTHYIEDLGRNHYQGDLIGRYRGANLIESATMQRQRPRALWDADYAKKVFLNTSPFYQSYLDFYTRNVHAPCNLIKIHKLDVIDLPNKFYFAIPRGLNVTIPGYAGCIIVDENSYEITKPAPFLHKRKLEMWKKLLDKFYYKFRHVA